MHVQYKPPILFVNDANSVFQCIYVCSVTISDVNLMLLYPKFEKKT